MLATERGTSPSQLVQEFLWKLFDCPSSIDDLEGETMAEEADSIFGKM
jgi:hypothetical protein